MMDYSGLEAEKNELKRRVEKLREEIRALNIAREHLMIANNAVAGCSRNVDEARKAVDEQVNTVANYGT